MEEGNWKLVIYCSVYRDCIQQNIWKQGMITLQPAAAFIRTQVYFNHRVLTVLTISRQINYSARTRGEKWGKISFPRLQQDKAACGGEGGEKEGVIFFFNYKRQIFIIYKYLPCMGLNVIYEPVA